MSREPVFRSAARVAAISGFLTLVTVGLGAQSEAGFVPVTDAMLEDPDPGDWLHWRRTQNGWGYSPLDQIDRENVGELTMTGEELWRRPLIPQPGEPGDESWGDVPFEDRAHVGSWMAPSYDPALELLILGTSVTSPAPKFLLGGHEKRHLYHNTTLALEVETGGETGAVVETELEQQRLICPSLLGGKDWEAGAYSPLTNAMYYPLRNLCSQIDDTRGPWRHALRAGERDPVGAWKGTARHGLRDLRGDS